MRRDLEGTITNIFKRHSLFSISIALPHLVYSTDSSDWFCREEKNMANSTSVTSSLLFQKTLNDLVKGIRSHKNNPAEYISQMITECKNELHTTDSYVKSEAIRKLTYLQMIGYNISWASFSIVEVMSQNKFEQKRIGYLAANQVPPPPPHHS